MKALQSLKNKVQNDYQSTFDFEKYEVSSNDKEVIINNEAIIFKNFRIMSDSAYKVCKALYENSLKLRAEGSFVEWYTSIGLTKDRVSELLKRYELYLHFQDKKEWVTSLSVRAIKMLTNKDLELNILHDVSELNLQNTEDIRAFLDARKSDDVIDIVEPQNTLLQSKNKCVNYNNFEKLKKNVAKMSAKEIDAAEKEIEALERYLKELKKSIGERGKVFENEKNLK
ncbi:MAG: hypothetical protein ACRDAS_07985, partial [Cetobacterium sp.]